MREILYMLAAMAIGLLILVEVYVGMLAAAGRLP